MSRSERIVWLIHAVLVITCLGLWAIEVHEEAFQNGATYASSIGLLASILALIACRTWRRRRDLRSVCIFLGWSGLALYHAGLAYWVQH